MSINNKRIIRLIIFIAGIYSVSIFAATQPIWEYVFEDATPFPGIMGGNEIAVNGNCVPSAIGQFKPAAFVEADKLYNLCFPNITACDVTLYVGTNANQCAGPEIGTAVINVYSGVQSINNEPSSQYQLSYESVNPKVQEVLITNK